MKGYKRFVVLAAVIMCVMTVLAGCGKKDGGDDNGDGDGQDWQDTTAQKSFGVFLGVDEIDVAKMAVYELVVIDADYIEKNEIAALRATGTAVYSYLNVGMIEEFRDYFGYVSGNWPELLGAANEDWPDERWVDCGNEIWQNYVVHTLAENLVAQGIDGFFLDNFDVYYYNNETQGILEGLTEILRKLKDTYNLPVMINGGDTAVRGILAIDDTLINSVNQESVFTSINFDETPVQFGVQGEYTRRYYQQYLSECKRHGVAVYLLEYGGKVAESVIRDYCAEEGYHYYVSKDLDLTTPQY